LKLGDPAQPGTKLVFSTPPLKNGATLSGPISATIHARSSNTNLRLIAKLYDVAPGGNAELFSTGVVLGSQQMPDPDLTWKNAAGTPIWPWPKLDRDTYLEPGRIYQFNVPFDPQHRALLPGHKLRLELTTQTPASICPEVAVPAANNNDVCRMTAPQAATLPGGKYTILYGPGHPSALAPAATALQGPCRGSKRSCAIAATTKGKLHHTARLGEVIPPIELLS